MPTVLRSTGLENNGIQAFRDSSGADVIVFIGGGSAIDAFRVKVIIYTIQKKSGGDFYKQKTILTTLSAAEYNVSVYFRTVSFGSDE
jgi:hypothetical protein